jgi:phosphoserine phosphatase
MDIRLVSFDLDGTLFPETTTCMELGRRFGHLDVITELERKYQNFEISNREVAEGDASAYAGRCVEEIERAVLMIPTIRGFAETIGTLHEHGMITLIVTVSWSFAARALARKHGITGYAGAEMTEVAGILTGQIYRHFEAEDKVRFVQGFGQQLGISLSQCAAVGDSRSDIPLFKAAGFSIALNATEHARAAATCSLQSNDLTDILPLILARYE